MFAHLAPLRQYLDATDATTQRTRATYPGRDTLCSIRAGSRMLFALHGVDCFATVSLLHHFARIFLWNITRVRVLSGANAIDAVQSELLTAGARPIYCDCDFPTTARRRRHPPQPRGGITAAPSRARP